MRISLLLPQAMIVAVLAASQAASALAGFTIKLNPNDLIKQGPGPLTADVGLFINWDGTGTNLISGINFDVTLPAAVTLPDTTLVAGTPANPLSFSNANILARSVSFANIAGDVAPLAAGDNLLTTLRFNVTANFGDFPIGLIPVIATTGSNFTNITNQVTATGGTLRVVPEPSSLVLLSLVTASSVLWRRRTSSSVGVGSQRAPRCCGSSMARFGN